MTDIEKFTTMLSDFHITGYDLYGDEGGQTRISLDQGCCKNVGGYVGFLSVWTFDSKGLFVDTASWE